MKQYKNDNIVNFVGKTLPPAYHFYWSFIFTWNSYLPDLAVSARLFILKK